MTLSTYAGNAVLDALLRNIALQIATPYVSLHSGDPALVGSNELSGNGYIRKLATYGAPSGGATDNAAAVTFGPATPNAWSAASYCGIWDQEAAGGNYIGGSILTSGARTLLATQYAEFAIGAEDFSIGTAFGTTTLNNIVNSLLRNTLLQGLAYLSLHTADPGLTGANELAGNGYGPRPLVTFGAAAAKICTNSAAVATTTASGNWTQATHGGLWTANAAGTFIWGYALTAPQTILTGFFFRAAIGEIVVKVDPV
jgi:hypothetical protein